MTIETRPFDPAAYLDSPDAVLAYLDGAFADGDAGEIADALGVVARAHGMSQLAKKTGLTRQALYMALSRDGIRSPKSKSSFSTTFDSGCCCGLGCPCGWPYFAFRLGCGSVYASQSTGGPIVSMLSAGIANLGCFSICLMAETRCS